jgi:hypothetical protein
VNVELTDGTAVELKPCPVWCLGDHGEFLPGTPVSPVIDCFHHRGPDATVSVAFRAELLAGEPDSVTVQLESFTEPLDGAPGPARIDIHLRASTGEAYTVLTPAEARALAASLLMLADTAQRASN